MIIKLGHVLRTLYRIAPVACHFVRHRGLYVIIAESTRQIVKFPCDICDLAGQLKIYWRTSIIIIIIII